MASDLLTRLREAKEGSRGAYAEPFPVAYLHECLNYDPRTGRLVWRIRPLSHFAKAGDRSSAHLHAIFNTQHAGTDAGGITGGYFALTLDRVRIQAHRAAWAMMTGKWPSFFIDHINGDRRDNRWDNLREATRAENCRNAKLSAKNTSGFKGVRASGRKWTANIRDGRRQLYLGVYDTPYEAHAAYCAAAIRLHGQFARKDTLTAKEATDDGANKSSQRRSSGTRAPDGRRRLDDRA